MNGIADGDRQTFDIRLRSHHEIFRAGHMWLAAHWGRQRGRGYAIAAPLAGGWPILGRGFKLSVRSADHRAIPIPTMSRRKAHGADCRARRARAKGLPPSAP